jgi:hypothetical protein
MRSPNMDRSAPPGAHPNMEPIVKSIAVALAALGGCASVLALMKGQGDPRHLQDPSAVVSVEPEAARLPLDLRTPLIACALSRATAR